ncbi:odorant receptor 2a-like [Cydia splendana]|uniref:odorant receptor 2a-like n=1 Tax=Cydia splendana TaxID=1100963 RepID=UPI00300C5ABB
MGVKFDKTFQISTTALYWNLGHPSIPVTLKWVIKMLIFYRMMIYCPVFITMIYSSIYYDSFSRICTNLGLAAVFGIISFNYTILIVYKKRFIQMMRIVEEDLERSSELNIEDEIVVRGYTAKGRKVTKYWLNVCIICDGFICKPVLGTTYFALTSNFTLVPIHELTYPTNLEERKNEFDMYLLIIAFQLFYVLLSSLMYVGFNPLGPIFIMHACGQMDLAIRQVRRLFLENNIKIEERIRRLRDIVRLVQNIYSFVDQIQETHKLLFEMYLKTSTVVIPISCFGIIESYHEGNLSLDLIGYVFACYTQCFIPCYYCEFLLSKGEEFRNAIYSCGWERYWGSRSRSMILLMLTRTARPLRIHALFSIVCFEAFANVNSQAYRIFNVLNAAWN